MLNLDTHILLYALAGKLRPREERLLGSDSWSISAIVLWEISKLAQLGRIKLDIRKPEFSRVIAQLHVWPLSLEVVRAIHDLDFSGDPADEIIAATSIIFNAPLVTRDKVILRSKRTPLAKL